jgi:hypothetical protein
MDYKAGFRLISTDNGSFITATLNITDDMFPYLINFLIPDGVEIWEYDEAEGTAEVLYPPAKSMVASVEGSEH